MSKGIKLSWDKALEISLVNSQPSGIEMTKFLISKAEKYDKKELLINALYFVVDGTGGHSFSSTLEEHNMHVQKFRQRMKEQESKE